MRIEQEKVELFHLRMQQPIGQKPELIEVGYAEKRHDFLTEENREYLEAVHKGDLVGIADAIADCLYIVLGTAVAHGIDIQPIFDEVHRSNMTKTLLDPVTKKGGKGPGYEPPRIAELLLIQATELQDAQPV